MVHTCLEYQEGNHTRNECNNGASVDACSARSADHGTIALVGAVAGRAQDIVGKGGVAFIGQAVPEIQLVAEEWTVGETKCIGCGGLKFDVGG